MVILHKKKSSQNSCGLLGVEEAANVEHHVYRFKTMRGHFLKCDSSPDTVRPITGKSGLSCAAQTTSLCHYRHRSDVRKPGCKYEEAVKSFEPYRETKEVYEEARKAGAALIQRGKKDGKKKTFLFVNNRLEGNALQTIRAILGIAETEILGNGV